MNNHFQSFIKQGKSIAQERGIRWDIALSSSGKALSDQRWNLTVLVGGTQPIHYLSHLGTDEATVVAINAKNVSDSRIELQPLPASWQDLIKASVVEQLFVRRNSTLHVANSVIRPLRVLATCSLAIDPWSITSDQINSSVEISRVTQPSGKLADLIVGLAKTLFDANHICDAGQLYPLLNVQRLAPRLSRRAKFTKSQEEIRSDLEDRKRQDRLPDRRAFWEMLRIITLEKPKNFIDELRFAGIRLMMLTGFRVGEAVLLPLDWKRIKNYVARGDRKVSDYGGFDSSLMIRYFAEKQRNESGDRQILFENVHHVPQIFSEIITETLDHIASITAPLRSTLKAQAESGRLLPSFGPTELVPLPALYTYLTGNPFFMDMAAADPEKWITACRLDETGSSFDHLYDMQKRRIDGGRVKLNMSAYQYFKRLRDRLRSSKSGATLRTSSGSMLPNSKRCNWMEAYVRIDEIESYIREELPTKLSDVYRYSLHNGHCESWEMLFLSPKRSLAEQRNDGICDINRYFSINAPTSDLFLYALGDAKSAESIFSRYGETDEDRSLSLTSHMFRHLQNTELFRLGIADTLITKRYGRNSVAQSYEYDHRSLAEELDQIEITPDTEALLGEKTSTVFKMIKAGRASGPIVDQFKRIQTDEGDAAAFDYLKVEADGFHATPYGHCLNSFTVDPCPKHLECFAGCRHLSATNLPENREILIRLEGKLAAALEKAKSKESHSVGRTNQIEHARVRLEGVRKILTCDEGQMPFPDGPDFSLRLPQQGVLDV